MQRTVLAWASNLRISSEGSPNDIDGYFVCDVHEFASGELERKQLHALKLGPDEVARALQTAKREWAYARAYRSSVAPCIRHLGRQLFSGTPSLS